MVILKIKGMNDSLCVWWGSRDFLVSRLTFHEHAHIDEHARDRGCDKTLLSPRGDTLWRKDKEKEGISMCIITHTVNVRGQHPASPRHTPPEDGAACLCMTAGAATEGFARARARARGRGGDRAARLPPLRWCCLPAVAVLSPLSSSLCLPFSLASVPSASPRRTSPPPPPPLPPLPPCPLASLLHSRLACPSLAPPAKHPGKWSLRPRQLRTQDTAERRTAPLPSDPSTLRTALGSRGGPRTGNRHEEDAGRWQWPGSNFGKSSFFVFF